MGWGTTFKPEVYLSKMSFTTKYELDDAIKDLEEWVETRRRELCMFAASNPKDILSEKVLSEQDDIEEWTPVDIVGNLESYINVIITDMIDDVNTLRLLYLFKQHLEETGDDIEKYNPFKKEFKE